MWQTDEQADAEAAEGQDGEGKDRNDVESADEDAAIVSDDVVTNLSTVPLVTDDVAVEGEAAVEVSDDVVTEVPAESIEVADVTVESAEVPGARDTTLKTAAEVLTRVSDSSIGRGAADVEVVDAPVAFGSAEEEVLGGQDEGASNALDAEAPSDTAIQVEVDGAELTQPEALTDTTVELSSDVPEVTDVNLKSETQAESIEDTEALLGLDGTDNVDLPMDAPEFSVQPLPGTRAETPSAASVATVGIAATAGGEGAANQGGAQQQGGNTANGNPEVAAMRAANRTQGAQKPQFSKLMLDRQVEVVRQIAKQIGLRSAAQADQRISMLLKPESLGAVRLDLSFEDDGSLSIDASVEESATRRLIASAVEELRSSLKSEGFQLNRLTVTEQSSVATNGHGGPALGDSAQGSSTQAGQGRGRGRGNSQQSGATQAQAALARNTGNEEQNSGRLRLGDVDLTA